MLAWFRRWPAHALNGVSVSVGVGLVHVVTRALSDLDFASAATMGAVLASMPHGAGRAVPTLRRTLAAGLLASLAALIVLALAEHPLLRGLAIAPLVFVTLLGMAWGTRAAPIVFAVTLGVIFSLARPSSTGAVGFTLASVCGVLLYAGWAFLNTKLLEPRYRTLAVVSTLQAAAALLLARAAVLARVETEADTEAGADDSARLAQVSAEARLAQALQAARDLVFPAAARRGSSRHADLISRVAELREGLLTSQLDLDLLGYDHAARFVRARLALGLRTLGRALEQLALASTPSSLDLPDMTEAEELLGGDARVRLLPVVTGRLRMLRDEVERIQSLLGGDAKQSSLRPEELTRSIADDESWPLGSLREHLSPASPVLRHALRSALAMTGAYFLAYALPWTTHPYWLLLSVAVVLRGTLDETLSRRNARVLGTAIGCVTVTVLVPLVSAGWLEVTFLGAVGATHAFVNVRYLLTAGSATVMALLQAHLAAPAMAPLVIERLLDTAIGALVAWAFSYVLPSWERRTLPASVDRALQALRAYGTVMLAPAGRARSEQRLARERAHDALAVVAAAVQRCAAEPQSVRPPVEHLVSALDHAQRLMAHLSALGSLLKHREDQLAPETLTALAVARQNVAERLLPRQVLPHGQTPEPSRAELPGGTVDENPLPWLMRRLAGIVHEASATGRSAREALNELARPTALPLDRELRSG